MNRKATTFWNFFFIKFKREKACNSFSTVPSPEERVALVVLEVNGAAAIFGEILGRGQPKPQEKLHRRKPRMYLDGEAGKGRAVQTRGTV